jgi:hypothetical protein
VGPQLSRKPSHIHSSLLTQPPPLSDATQLGDSAATEVSRYGQVNVGHLLRQRYSPFIYLVCAGRNAITGSRAVPTPSVSVPLLAPVLLSITLGCACPCVCVCVHLFVSLVLCLSTLCVCVLSLSFCRDSSTVTAAPKWDEPAHFYPIKGCMKGSWEVRSLSDMQRLLAQVLLNLHFSCTCTFTVHAGSVPQLRVE